MKKAKKVTSRIAAMLLSAMLAAGSVPGVVFASEPQWDPGRYPETAAEGSYNAWEPGMSNGLQEENEETANDVSTDEAYAAAENTAVDDEENNPVMDEDAVDEKTNEEGAAADTEWIGAVPEQETVGSGEVQENADHSETVETVSEEDPFGQTEDQALVDDGMSAEDALSETAQDALAEDAAAGDTFAEDAAAEDTLAGDALAEDAVAEDALAGDAAAGDALAEDAAAGDTLAEDAVAEDAFTEDAVTENASTEDTAADDAVSENPLISEGESETTEEQSANADMAGTIIDSGECDVGSNVTWTLYEDGKLIIRGQGVLLDYQNEGEPWYKYKDSLFTVVVESGLTGIPGYAFSGCSSLTSIELPEDVKYFGKGVFSGCSSLTSIELPKSLEHIDDDVFSGCSSLTSIEVPEDIVYFGKGVFSGCSSLTSVKLPNSMERIDSNVFSDCSSLTSIELPESIDYISDGVFSGCSSLISIELPESLEYIDDGAFSGCSSLTSIELPEGLEKISLNVFSGCSNLQRITLPSSMGSIFDAFSGCSSLSEVIYVGTQWCWDQVYVAEGQVEFNGATKTFLNKNCMRYTEVTGLSDMTYTGEAITQSPVVEYNGTTLTEGTDYTVSYVNNIDHGVAGVIITGQGDYIGKKKGDFSINKAAQTITASDLSLTYLNTGTITVSGNKGELSYTSSNTDIATVDSTGKVTAKGIGTATIMISAEETDNYEAAAPKEITVTVSKAAQTITASDLTLAYLKTGTITISGNKGELSYTSSNTDIATVDSTGKVTAKGIGTATITISAGETDNYEAAEPKSITVTVTKAAQSITASNLSLTFPNSGKITASGNKGSLSYRSSNTAIATVDSAGKVTAKGAGKATITITAAATSNYNAATKQITVTVAKAAQSITAKAAASSIAVGKTTTVSITGAKGTKSFKSSDTTVAAVNASTGLVTAKKVGTVKITATSAATAQYNAASKTVTIKVVPAATASLTAANQATGIKLTWKKVTGANGYKVYRGSTLIKTITSGSTVTYADTKANTNGTKYTYKVVAKASTGDSTLSKSVSVYRVARPAVPSVTNSASKKMTVKWGKNAKANGYQIQYSTDKTFKSGNKAVTVAGASTVSKVIGSLTKGKTYYVRIRTYKTVGSAKYWSVWSSARSVKISK